MSQSQNQRDKGREALISLAPKGADSVESARTIEHKCLLLNRRASNDGTNSRGEKLIDKASLRVHRRRIYVICFAHFYGRPALHLVFLSHLKLANSDKWQPLFIAISGQL